MARINVCTYDSLDGDDARYALRVVGWFEVDTATHYPEATRWDGSNHISRATGSQWSHQGLYRTRGGRWVLESWSQWASAGPASYVFIDADAALHWLRLHEHTEAISVHFAPDPEESGAAATAGADLRNVRVKDDLWDAALVATRARGTTVSAVVRDALREYLRTARELPRTG